MQNQIQLDKEAIIAYLEEKATPIKVNDFLKSFYPLPKGNEGDLSILQGANARYRAALEEVVKGDYEVVNNQHQKLGSFYYPTEDGKTHYYNIKNVTIEVKKK